MSPLCYSFHVSPHLVDGAFAFNVHIFSSLDASALTQSWASLICLSSFLPPCPLRRSIIEHWGKVTKKKGQTCSRVQSEISKIFFQLWEMVITVDKSLGIKFLLMASRCTRWESIAFIYLSLVSIFLPFSLCPSNCLLLGFLLSSSPERNQVKSLMTYPQNLFSPFFLLRYFNSSFVLSPVSNFVAVLTSGTCDLLTHFWYGPRPFIKTQCNLNVATVVWQQYSQTTQMHIPDIIQVTILSIT